MINKRFWFATVAVFIVVALLEMIVHGKLLQGLYVQTASVWRPEAELHQMMWMMWLGYLVSSPLFVYIFSKGVEEGKSRVGQGIRFGVIIGLFTSVPMSLGSYVVMPVPGILAFYWFAAGFVESVVAGLITGLIYRK